MKKRIIDRLICTILPVMVVILTLAAPVFASEYSCTATIPVETELSGTPLPVDLKQEIIINAVDSDNPMPEIDSLLFTNSEKQSFGPITYVVPNDYHYRISQKKGNVEHVIYDETVYTVTVRVTNADDGGLQTAIWAIKDGEENKVDEIRFVNIYDPPVEQVKTGDVTNINMWILLMLSSVICLILVWKHKKTINEETKDF